MCAESMGSFLGCGRSVCCMVISATLVLAAGRVPLSAGRLLYVSRVLSSLTGGANGTMSTTGSRITSNFAAVTCSAVFSI
jgi:hypothetical protein